ncbi:MAG: tetratricopeptide repeat protein [Deltaproteobacteria bacterium]|nr:tetratricopeptide repeat protein [Deltaproteobacteria bacterium]
MRFRLSLALLAVAACFAPAAQAEDLASRAQAALAASRYEDARTSIDELRKAGKNAQAGLLDAELALVTGRYQDAVRLGRKAGRDSAVAPRALPIVAEALARTGKRDDAVRVLEPLLADDSAHRAHVLHGELLIEAGRRADAESVLMRPIDAYNDDRIPPSDAEGLALAGRAAYLMRHPQDANRLYGQAEAASRAKSAEILRWRAELFLDKYDPGHAAEVAREALAVAPNDPRARVTMAHVKLDQAMDFAAAEEEVRAALAVDPNLAEAYFVRAGLALRTMDLDAADAATKAGLAIDPTNLELLSIAAATRFLADDSVAVDTLRKQVLARNPNYARFFTIVSEFAEWEHRYEDIVAMMREAVRIDPDESKAHAALGLNLIRNGQDDEGLAALRRSFAKDYFNVRVFNTLNFFERTVARDYVTVDGARFRIRYHKDEKAVLERYLPRMLEQAWASMTARYRFTPTQPVGIELYADPEHFSVRTSGLPNVGIQGVCFGKTLAALSPGAASFNWGMIVWHELSHVFHIQQSRSHVPRWFTEGLAEYETMIARPEWRREEEPALFHGLRQGKLPGVGSFNRAFTHVDNVSDVVMAYFAASQLQAFSGERYGFERFPRMLEGWGAGKRTPDLVREVYGIETAELDRQYLAWQQPRLARYARQFMPAVDAPSLEDARKALAAEPKSAARHATLARALAAAGKADEADATLAIALSLDPNEPDALFGKLRLALAKRELDGAAKLVERLVKAGHDGYAVRMKAADVAEAKDDLEVMRRELFAAHAHDPSQVEPLQAIHDVARKRKDANEELFALRKLAALDQHDRRVWRKLLRMLVERGQWEEAVRIGESAMYVDVMHPETHLNYARALARTGRHVSAIFELNSALKAKPEPRLASRIYAMMAEGYRRLGKEEYAARAEALARALPSAGTDAAPVSPIDEELD